MKLMGIEIENYRSNKCFHITNYLFQIKLLMSVLKSPSEKEIARTLSLIYIS
jgi:hypothetical protein